MADFFAVTLIIMLAAISPGPDFAMVVKNSLLHDRKSGVLTALGVSTSLFIHSGYCILGLAIIISQSLWLFNIIKYMGAAYLIYIGIKSLLAKYEVTDVSGQQTRVALTAFGAFSQGVLCNLLNPKAILFILAFFTLVVSPSISLAAQMGYGLEIVLIHIIWFTSLACMITHARVKKNLSKVQHYIVKVMGVALIGFGARIAL